MCSGVFRDDAYAQLMRLQDAALRGDDARSMFDWSWWEYRGGDGETFAAGEKTWSVRPESIVRRGRDTVVFVRTDKGFRVQPVTVIEEDRDAARVTGPLQAGDSIAIRGIVALKGAWQGLGGSQ